MAGPWPAWLTLVARWRLPQPAASTRAFRRTSTVRPSPPEANWRLRLADAALVSYLAPGGVPGDVIKGCAICDRSTYLTPCHFRVEADYEMLTVVVGRKLAFTTVTFMDKYGDIAARGSHTKCVSRLADKGAKLMPHRYLTTVMTREDAFVPPEEFAEEASDRAMSPHTLSNPYPSEHARGPRKW